MGAWWCLHKNFCSGRAQGKISEKAGCKIVESDVRQIATMKKELTEEEEEKMQNFLDRMEENDDVQNVWHNADM